MKIDICYRNLTSLDGIPLPEGLTELCCGGNRLTSLPPLPSTLTKLYCENNQLRELPPLPSSLVLLHCGSNQLSSLPSLPPSLTHLNCPYSKLDSLPPLPPTLTNLYCWGNQLTRLPPLPQSLTKLWCGDNQLTSLPPLPSPLTELFGDRNKFPPRYIDKCQLKPTKELRLIIRLDRLRVARSILERPVGNQAARNIQRVWKRYWWKPYFDEGLGYEVSRYMISHRSRLAIP